jgi:hypothetical protein
MLVQFFIVAINAKVFMFLASFLVAAVQYLIPLALAHNGANFREPLLTLLLSNGCHPSLLYNRKLLNESRTAKGA